MRRKVLVMLIVFLGQLSGVAWAIDPQTAKAYCDDVKKASLDAQSRYLALYKPPIDPGQVFENATTSCLQGIASYQLNIPSVFDGILTAMATKLLQQVCQAARDQFNQAVNNAAQTVNQSVGQVDGVNTGISVSNGQSGVQSDGGSLMQGAGNSVVDRVVNMFK